MEYGLYGNDNGKAINSYEINYLVLWAKKTIELRTNNYAKALFPWFAVGCEITHEKSHSRI